MVNKIHVQKYLHMNQLPSKGRASGVSARKSDGETLSSIDEANARNRKTFKHTINIDHSDLVLSRTNIQIEELGVLDTTSSSHSESTTDSSSSHSIHVRPSPLTLHKVIDLQEVIINPYLFLNSMMTSPALIN